MSGVEDSGSRKEVLYWVEKRLGKTHKTRVKGSKSRDKRCIVYDSKSWEVLLDKKSNRAMIRILKRGQWRNELKNPGGFGVPSSLNKILDHKAKIVIEHHHLNRHHKDDIYVNELLESMKEISGSVCGGVIDSKTKKITIKGPDGYEYKEN